MSTATIRRLGRLFAHGELDPEWDRRLQAFGAHHSRRLLDRLRVLLGISRRRP